MRIKETHNITVLSWEELAQVEKDIFHAYPVEDMKTETFFRFKGVLYIPGDFKPLDKTSESNDLKKDWDSIYYNDDVTRILYKKVSDKLVRIGWAYVF